MSPELASNYEGAFDSSLGFGERPALILIDFVQAYFDPDSVLFADVDAALASALRLRKAALNAGIPVILTNVVYSKGFLDAGVFGRKVPALKNFVCGDPQGDWPEGLEPGDRELIVSKQYPSAFFGTSLASTLRASSIDSLIITGLTTSGCVRATCVDACSHGFIPIIVEEACGDRDELPHRANLFDMNAKYGDVLKEANVLAYIETLTSNGEQEL